ncbi:hypothetical protein MPL3365_170019 [Mesorhizobium plurifarium]|uniref:Uncharacterized protein n=1 Tax=Mesorhizobium plurifarium TaxID=69974 RepID=A0A090FYW1_MESPL|nr:hypothetical protein MPL3365_170019 [Mesorhizobium plurifarium]
MARGRGRNARPPLPHRPLRDLTGPPRARGTGHQMPPARQPPLAYFKYLLSTYCIGSIFS